MSAAASVAVAFFSIFMVVAAILICAYLSVVSGRTANHNRSSVITARASPAHADDGDEGDRRQPLDEFTILSYPRLRCSQAASNGVVKSTAAGDGLGNICPICLSNYQETDVVRILPKRMHFYHLKCIDPWLKLHLNCPICRKQLL